MITLEWAPHPRPYNAARPGKGVYTIKCTECGDIPIRGITPPSRAFADHVKVHVGDPKGEAAKAMARAYNKGIETRGAFK